MTRAIIWWGMGAVQMLSAIYVAPSDYIRIVFAAGAIAAFIVAFYFYNEAKQ